MIYWDFRSRLNFSTAFSTNAVSICKSIGLERVTRIEYSIRYLITVQSEAGAGDSVTNQESLESRMVSVLHDKMTQCRYETPVQSFRLSVKPDPVYAVDIMHEGRKALEKVNNDLGRNWVAKFVKKLLQCE